MACLSTGIISSLIFILVGVGGVQVYALENPEFGPLDHIYNITIGDQSYPIKYGISSDGNTAIKNMTVDEDSKSIKIVINDNSNTTAKRFFMIELPRNVINANTTEIAGGCTASTGDGSLSPWKQEHDLPYTIVVSRVDSEGDVVVYNGSQGEQCGRDARILSIEYLSGESAIVIQGTTLVPEFDLSISILVMAIALVGVIGTSIIVRNKTQNMNR